MICITAHVQRVGCKSCMRSTVTVTVCARVLAVNEADEATSSTDSVLINGPSQSTYTIPGLEPDTRYRVSIHAFSAVAIGEAVSLVTKTKSSKTDK